MIGFGGNSCSGGVSSMDMMMNIDDTNNNSNNREVIPSISVVSHNNSGAQNRRVVSVLNMANHQDHHNNSCSSSNSVRDKIMAHPLFPRLLSSYLNCLKVGAPPEVVARLEELSAKCESSSIHHQHHHHVSDHKMSNGGSTIGGIGEVDPGLDQFMEAYCEMLIKYEQELTKPFKEAMLFFSRIESQLKDISLSSSSTLDHFGGHHVHHQSESSSLHHNNINEVDENSKKKMMMIDTELLSEERELKMQLLRKYSGYLGGLKKEFLKKKKNGKLPKEARQQLLDWWSRHFKWPYPSESQKQELAESTGLDLKQINNWFINQRKRHWKPSEDMQFAVMDATNHYIESIMCKPFSIDAMPVLF